MIDDKNINRIIIVIDGKRFITHIKTNKEYHKRTTVEIDRLINSSSISNRYYPTRKIIPPWMDQ